MNFSRLDLSDQDVLLITDLANFMLLFVIISSCITLEIAYIFVLLFGWHFIKIICIVYDFLMWIICVAWM